MVMEHESNGVILTEKRAEGVTVAERLAQWQRERTRGLFRKRVPELPSATPPGLHFEEFTYFYVSPANDLDYFVAIGRDEDRSTIIVNDQVVFNEPVQEVEVVDYSVYKYKPDGKPRFLCLVKDSLGLKSSLFYVNQDGVKPILDSEKPIIVNQRVASLNSAHLIDRAIGVRQGHTDVVYFKDDGKILRCFSIDKELHYPENASTSCTSDLTTLTRTVQDPESAPPGEKRYSYYRDDQLIAEDIVESRGYVGIAFSKDYKTQIAVTKGADERAETLIVKDGMTIERVSHASQFSFDWMEANEDLSLVAIGFKGGPEGSKAFFMTPDIHGWTPNYESDYRPWASFSESSLQITYQRNGIERTLTIPKSKGQPEETTDEGKSVA